MEDHKRKDGKKKKQPGMKVFVHIHDRVFPVCIGKGNQDFRWLSMVAANRYSNSRPHGRIRQRESNTQRDIGNFVPNEALLEKKQKKKGNINPKSKLNKLLKNGDHIEVHLRTGQEAEYTRFESFAFLNSNAAKERREREEQIRQLREREETRRRFEENARRRKENEALLFGSSGEVSEEKVNEIFEKDYSQMDISAYLKNEEERRDIKATLRSSYLALRELFLHYANEEHDADGDGIDDGEGAVHDNKMSIREFVQFVSDAGVLNGSSLTEKTVMKIFRKTNEEYEQSGDAYFQTDGDDAFDRPEFMESMFLIARKRFKGEKGGDPSQQFDHLMAHFILPHFEKVRSTDFRSILLQPENADILTRNIDCLKGVYDKYTNRHDDDDVVDMDDAATIDIDEFELMMKEAGLLGDDLSDSMLSKCFLDSQKDTFEDGELSNAEGQLSFEEFMEAISRVAHAKGGVLNASTRRLLEIEVEKKKANMLKAGKGLYRIEANQDGPLSPELGGSYQLHFDETLGVESNAERHRRLLTSPEIRTKSEYEMRKAYLAKLDVLYRMKGPLS
eukprot:g2609.t1